jgi:hypothetical protein
MADLLSPAWFGELAERLASVPVLGDASTRLSLGQVVDDAPGGPIAWTIHVGGGESAWVELGVDSAEVTIIEDFATATALANGIATSELLFEGKIKITGSVDALLARVEMLTHLNAALSA